MGDSKMIWIKISELKNKNKNTFDKIILKKKTEKLTENDKEVLNVMKNYMENTYIENMNYWGRK